MKIQIKKSGNSASLRIPPEVLRDLNLSIGEMLVMSVSNNSLHFKKEVKPRDGWFDSICPIAAANEAKEMENDFGQLQNADLDDWEYGEEW